MKHFIPGSLLLIFLCCLFPLYGQQHPISEKVEISGLVAHPFTLTPGDTQGLRLQTIKNDRNVTGMSGEIKQEIRTFKGILLRDIIDKAGVDMPHKKDRGRYIVYVIANDGYKVAFAWNELYYGPAADHTWLLLEKNGKPITKNGRFIVFCASDVVTGPRHVKWVSKIEIRRLD
ncbi:molybdopterin-dependent oxidoreductase [Sinomicrobium oceani]|uniref:molybdopterin-dependent oxidoreductase n=1 Tax=Sinomicrobium oceani TaxID=1150368 RepID=UPI00227C46B4|nr:molybdopterin-dependent oxidoreductase [Sinomicrobium oceani]